MVIAVNFAYLYCTPFEMAFGLASGYNLVIAFEYEQKFIDECRVNVTAIVPAATRSSVYPLTC